MEQSGSKATKAESRMSAAKKRKMKKIAVWIAIVGLIVGGVWWLKKHPGTTVDISKGKEETIYADDWITGPADAKVTIIEFGDFQCPACRSYQPLVKKLLAAYPNDVRLVFREFPLLQVHPHALEGAQAAEAAGHQGKFWEMFDILYTQQNEWVGDTTAGGQMNHFKAYAQSLGMNVDQFVSDFSSPMVQNKISRDLAEAGTRQLTGTPSFIVNGVSIDNPSSYEAFASIIDAAIAQKKAAAVVPPTEVHEHADFAVYLDGKKVDFSLPKYQSEEGKEKTEFVHLHDGNGTVIHKHQTGVTLGTFFESLGIHFSKACFTLDTGADYCNTNTKTLKFFVNGKENGEFADYELHDNDRILVSYGPKEDAAIAKQIASVTDLSCIYSETCPERGKPPTESCVGGLGTKCDTAHATTTKK